MPCCDAVIANSKIQQEVLLDLLLNFLYAILRPHFSVLRSSATEMIQPEERQHQQRRVAGCRVKPEDGPGRQVQKVAAPM